MESSLSASRSPIKRGVGLLLAQPIETACYPLARRCGMTRPVSGSRVRDGHRGADRSLGPGLLPAAGVVAVAGQRSADHRDRASVGVDDDLVGGGVPIVALRS
jgi:hypothetical protein